MGLSSDSDASAAVTGPGVGPLPSRSESELRQGDGPAAVRLRGFRPLSASSPIRACAWSGAGPAPDYPGRVAEFAIPAREYALVFGTAVVVTFLLTGVVRLLATRMGAVTPIRERDVHSLPIPRMGGVAVYAGFAAAVLMALQLPALGAAFVSSSEVVGVLAAGGLICLVGVIALA